MLSKQEAKTNHRAHSVVTLSSLVVFFFFALFFFAVSLFIFFFVRFFPNEDIGSYPAIRGFWVEVFWTCSAHAQMVRLLPLGNGTDNMSTSVLRGRKLLCGF